MDAGVRDLRRLITAKAIRNIVYKKPWRPVTFVVDGGETYRAEHPDNITLHRDELFIVTMNGDWAIFEPVAVSAVRRERGRK